MYLYSIYWIMDDSSLRLLKKGELGERMREMNSVFPDEHV